MTKFTSFLSLAELAPKTRALIEKYQKEITDYRPMPVQSLCTALGIAVGWGNQTPYTGEAYMHALCPLALTRQDDKFTIFCNSTLKLTRQRYSIAHGLAHILLEGDGLFTAKTAKHTPRSDLAQLPCEMYGQPLHAEDCNFRGGLSEKAEWAANQLAGMILMPTAQIDQFLENDRKFGINSLAKRFGVSSQLVVARMGVPVG